MAVFQLLYQCLLRLFRPRSRLYLPRLLIYYNPLPILLHHILILQRIKDRLIHIPIHLPLVHVGILPRKEIDPPLHMKGIMIEVRGDVDVEEGLKRHEMAAGPAERELEDEVTIAVVEDHTRGHEVVRFCAFVYSFFLLLIHIIYRLFTCILTFLIIILYSCVS